MGLPPGSEPPIGVGTDAVVFVAMLFHGDATNEEVLDSKYYLSKLSSASLCMPDVAHLASQPDLTAKEFMPFVRSHRAVCGPAMVVRGSGEECYGIVRRAFTSVGAPTWDRRATREFNVQW